MYQRFHQRLNLQKKNIYIYINPSLIYFSQLGFEQHVYATNVPNQHDGSSDNHGPITARRRDHGGKDHVRHANVQAGEATDGGIRLSKSNHYALTR